MRFKENKFTVLSSCEQQLSAKRIDESLLNSRIIGFIVFTIFCLAINPLIVNAQDPPDPQAKLLIPPNTAGPIEVFVDVAIWEIFAINEQEETFKADAYLGLQWMDERLAFDPDTFGYEQKVYQDETALEILKTEMWWPTIEVANALAVNCCHLVGSVLDGL